jgi:nicotinamidase-related amidase
MLKPENTFLLMIDIQIKLLSAMYEKEALLDNAQKLVKGLQLLDVPFIVTEQNPKGLGPTQPEISQLVPDFQPLPKFYCNSCHESEIYSVITGLKRKQVLLCGIEAHICVYQTALELLGSGYEVQVVTDVVSSRSIKNRDIALSRLQSEGAKLTTVEMALFELLQTAQSPKFKDVQKVIK